MEINISKEQDSNSFKDNLVLKLPTLNKIIKLISRVFLLLPIDLGKSLLPSIKFTSTLVKKNPHYIIVPTKEAKLKKKINGNIGEQNTVIKKRIKSNLNAYISFLTDIINN